MLAAEAHTILGQGCLDKMQITPAAPAQYALPLNEKLLPLNEYIGQTIRLRHTGVILCTHCGRKTKKSFNQGYCYPCFQSLAQCDSCIVSPEKCHLHLGTCREPDWAATHCQTDHIVYLANSTGIKVGITRASQMPTRWLDQGAVQALPIARVANRYASGLFEVICKQFVADKTDWRGLLRSNTQPIDLYSEREKLLRAVKGDIALLQQRLGVTAVTVLPDEVEQCFSYPIQRYAEKVSTHNFDKTPTVEGELLGMKGQYLMLSTGALNIRKFTAYEVEFSVL